VQHEGTNGIAMEGMINDNSKGSNRIPLMQHEGTNGIPMEGVITSKDPMEYH
jgi:hypothetical protein